MLVRTRVAGALIGVVFGIVLSWSGMTSPEVIREGLLFADSYPFLFFASAVSTAFAGLWILRRRAPRALLTGERAQWQTVRPERRHVVGSLLFGVGWGVSGACPGPIATQLGQGIAWGVPTTVGQPAAGTEDLPAAPDATARPHDSLTENQAERPPYPLSAAWRGRRRPLGLQPSAATARVGAGSRGQL